MTSVVVWLLWLLVTLAMMRSQNKGEDRRGYIGWKGEGKDQHAKSLHTQ